MYSIFEQRPEDLLKMFIIDVDKRTLPRRPQNIISEHFFKNAFLYCWDT